MSYQANYYDINKEEAVAIVTYANLKKLRVTLSHLPMVSFIASDGAIIEIHLKDLVEDYRLSHAI